MERYNREEGVSELCDCLVGWNDQWQSLVAPPFPDITLHIIIRITLSSVILDYQFECQYIRSVFLHYVDEVDCNVCKSAWSSNFVSIACAPSPYFYGCHPELSFISMLRTNGPSFPFDYNFTWVVQKCVLDLSLINDFLYISPIRNETLRCKVINIIEVLRIPVVRSTLNACRWRH